MAGRQLIVPVRRSTIANRLVILRRRCRRPEGTMALVVMVTGIEVLIVIVVEFMAGTTIIPEIATEGLAVAHFIMVLIEMVIVMVMVVIMTIVVIVVKMSVMRTGRGYTVRRRISNYTEMVASATSMAVTGTRTFAKITGCETAESFRRRNWFVNRLKFNQMRGLHCLGIDCMNRSDA